jgi:hypothetical protein
MNSANAEWRIKKDKERERERGEREGEGERYEGVKESKRGGLRTLMGYCLVNFLARGEFGVAFRPTWSMAIWGPQGWQTPYLNPPAAQTKPHKRQHDRFHIRTPTIPADKCCNIG